MDFDILKEEAEIQEVSERDLQEFAESFIDCVRLEFKKELTYEPQSLEQVDGLEDALRKILKGRYASFNTLLLGSYFGEVLRRNLGGCWQVKHFMEPALELVKDVVWAFPFATAEDWLTSGDESFAFSFRASKRLCEEKRKARSDAAAGCKLRSD